MDKIIESLVSDFADEHDLARLALDKQFERFSNYCVVSVRGTEETFNPEDVTVEGDEFGIDGLAVQINGRIVTDPDEIDGLAEQNGYLEVVFFFVQAKTSEKFSTSAVELMGRAIKDFFADEANLPQTDFVKRSREIKDEVYRRAKFFKRGNPALIASYVTTGKWDDQTEICAAIEGVSAELDSTRLFDSVVVEPVDASRLNDLYRRAHDPVETTFEFARKATMPAGIPGIESAYVGVVEGTQFLRLIEDGDGRLRSSLFEDNVRDFQGIDNAVNAQMADTVEGADRGRFPVLNNGVTVIAREVQTVGDSVIVRDYQIVNGCQTANVVHAHRDRALGEEFWVPLKVVATDDDDLITEIVTATNSQTAVRPEELSSRSRFERALEQYFEAVSKNSEDKGLRYERRSRQYVRDAAVVAARVIPRRILVRSYVSFCLDQPHRATGYVTTLLKQMGSDHFVEGHRPEPYYTSAHAYYRLGNLFNSGRIDGKYRPAWWYLLMAFRHLALDGEPLAAANSPKVAKQMDGINKTLNDDSKAVAAFEQAVALFDSVLGDSLDRDVLRGERPAERLRDALDHATLAA
ncbi:MAG TPA: AIPR family protein [Solirubrobacteraceae bacterium]|nr:AIPR family protein [Solirubrobacteraceae bacterium]